MTIFDAAAATVQSALATGRIGTPLAVRAIVHESADHGSVMSDAARVLAAAARWLAATPHELTARGGPQAGQVSLLARFPAGQTALVSTGGCGVGRPVVEILVVGNRGTLSWEPEPTPIAGPPLIKPAVPPAGLVEAVGKALASGATVTPGGGGKVLPPAKAADRKRRTPVPRIKAMKPPYGVLLVAGDHTHQPGYAASLAADKRCRLVGLADEAGLSPRRRRLNARLAKRLKIPLLPDLEQALARRDVQVVSVCAEPRRRGRIIVAAARAGKHLYLDKPLAATLAETDAVVEAVRGSGVISHMWSLVRTPIGKRIREALRSADLGDLRAIHVDLSFAKGAAGTAKLGSPRREQSSPEVYELKDSKRELSNVGVYPLVSLLWLLGRPIRQVLASTGNFFFAEHQANDMEDYGQLLLDLEGGVVATVTCGRNGWRSSRGGGINRVCLVGSRQSVVVDTQRPRVAVWADVEPWTAPQRDPEDPMGMWGGPRNERFVPAPRRDWVLPASPGSSSDASYFLDCIERGRQSDVSVEVAAQATEALLGAYRSAAAGRAVKLPLPRG